MLLSVICTFKLNITQKYFTYSYLFLCRFAVEDESENENDYNCEEKSVLQKSSLSTISLGTLGNIPLCGKFSNMNLGSSFNKCMPHTPQQSYLFKPNKPLIQPSKLRIDNHDEIIDTPRTSPTVSSGYESVASFLKKIPDSVSEFDSISQVDIPRRRNLLPTMNIPSSYYYVGDSSRLANTDPCYGASPVYLHTTPSNLSNDRSHIQVNASVPILQVVLCSLMCFVLGFLFQTFVSEIYF